HERPSFPTSLLAYFPTRPALRLRRDLGAREVNGEVAGEQQRVRPGHAVLVRLTVAVDVATRRVELGDDVGELDAQRNGLSEERVEPDAELATQLRSLHGADVFVGIRLVLRRGRIAAARHGSGGL